MKNSELDINKDIDYDKLSDYLLKELTGINNGIYNFESILHIDIVENIPTHLQPHLRTHNSYTVHVYVKYPDDFDISKAFPKILKLGFTEKELERFIHETDLG